MTARESGTAEVKEKRAAATTSSFSRWAKRTFIAFRFFGAGFYGSAELLCCERALACGCGDVDRESWLVV